MDIYVYTYSYNKFTCIIIIQETKKHQKVTSKKKDNVSPADQAGKTGSSLSSEQQSRHRYNTLVHLIFNV